MSKTELIKRILFTAAWAAVIIACVPVLIIAPLKERALKAPMPMEILSEGKTQKNEYKAYQPRQTKIIDIADCEKNIGSYVKLRANVMSVKDTGKVTFINFNKNYKEGFVVVVFGKDYKRFPQRPALMYKDKMITIEGRLKMYRGRPEIILRTPDQITAD